MFAKLSPRGRPAAPSASWERQVRTKNAVMRARSSKQVIAMPDESRSPNKKPPSTVAHELQTLHEALSELRAHLDGTAAAAATAAVLTDSPASTRAESAAIPVVARSSSKPALIRKASSRMDESLSKTDESWDAKAQKALALVSVAEAALAGLADSQAFGKGTPIQQRVPSFKPGRHKEPPTGLPPAPAPEPKLEGGRKPSSSGSLGGVAANSDRDTDGADAAPEPPPRRPASRPTSPVQQGSRPASPVGPDVTARLDASTMYKYGRWRLGPLEILHKVYVWADATSILCAAASQPSKVTSIPFSTITSVVGLEDDRRLLIYTTSGNHAFKIATVEELGLWVMKINEICAPAAALKASWATDWDWRPERRSGESPTPRVPSFPRGAGRTASPAPQPKPQPTPPIRQVRPPSPVASALPTAKYGLSPRDDKYGLNYDDATKDATPKMLTTTPSYVPSTTPEGSPRDPPSSVQLRV